jgi:hypothetical protein
MTSRPGLTIDKALRDRQLLGAALGKPTRGTTGLSP